MPEATQPTPGTSTTTSSPTPTESSTPAGGDSGGDDFDYAGLAAHDENEPLVPETGETGAQPASPPAAPASSQPAAASIPAAPASATPPAPPAAAAVVPPSAPPEPPAAQPAVATPPATAQQPPAAPELTPDQHREKFVPQLAAMYKLSDAEVEELRVNPGEALPKLAAQLHYNVQMAAVHGILTALPSYVAQVMRSHEVGNKNEQEFYGQWPALKQAAETNPQALQVITNAITQFRQLNPKATLAETIANAGMLAMMSLKLPLTIPGQNGAAGQPVAAPAAPPAPPQPPRPPGAGATGHVPIPLASGTEGVDVIADLVESHLRGEI